MKKFAERSPIGYTLTIWVIMMLGYVIAGAATQILKLDSTTQIFLSTGILSVIALLLVGVQSWWRAVGFTPLAKRRDWLLYLVPLAMPVLNLARGFHVSGLGVIATLLVAALLTGFVEEIYFRGLILRALAPKGLAWATFAPAILFAFPHILNVLSGKDLAASLAQVGYALALGVCFGLIRLRTGAVWPMMLVHGINNFFAWTADGGTSGGEVSTLFLLVVPTAIVVVFGAYSVYLWRSLKAAPGGRRAAA